MLEYDVVVIGGGPAGMAAAVSAFDSGVKSVAIIEREETLGGILMQCIHNGFGLHKLGKELTGPEYAYEYKKMVEKRDIKVYTETSVIKLTKNKEIVVSNNDGVFIIIAKSVVLAMGCRERSRGALNICGLRPAGVFTAGTAQKLMNCYGFKVGDKAVILGSGDIGLIMARRLSLQGVKVEAVCELMSYSNGLARNIKQCLEDFNIPLFLSTTVAEIHGKERLEGLTIADVDENRNIIPSTKRYIECDTLLLACGLVPENELSRQAGITINKITGGAVVDEDRQTDVEGIFACGNVLHVHDLVDYVSEEAEIAGKSAAKFVKNLSNSKEYVEVVAGQDVRYVLPQRISKNAEEVSLFFRVLKPSKNSKVIIKVDGKIIKEIKKQRLSPSEMERVAIKDIKQSGKITLEIGV